MIKLTKLRVNFVALIIPIIIFFIISNYFKPIFQNNFNEQEVLVQNLNILNLEKTEELNNSNQNLYTTKDKYSQEYEFLNEFEWQIKIPVISLNAEIHESTEKEVMDKYVGHFEESSTTNGNVALAAHNRGYAVNYFANIKNLKINDEIMYKYKDYQKTYLVQEITIIKDTDWTYIENTKENVITLITCVENQPEYRRVIRGIERK